MSSPPAISAHPAVADGAGVLGPGMAAFFAFGVVLATLVVWPLAISAVGLAARRRARLDPEWGSA